MSSNWHTKQLGELCRIRTGKKDVNQGNPEGEFPFFTCAAEHTFSDSYSFDTEALLIAGNGDVGKVSYYSGKFEAYQRTYVLSDFVGVLPRFLYLILDGKLKDTVSKQKLGNTMPYIKVGMLTGFELPVPPLPEQRRLVDILDEAFDCIATARANAAKNLQSARFLFESHLQSIFMQRGNGWKQTPLGSLCKLISGQHIDAKDYNMDQKGVGYLTGPSDFGFVNPVVTKWTEHPKRMAKRGDILVTVKGSGVGKINLLDMDDVAISRQLMAVRANAADVSYLYAFLSTNFAHFQSLSNGAAIPGISREDVLNLMCPMPPPEEQPSIVKLIHSVAEETQRLGSIYQRKLAALEELKKSMLNQAFSGKL